jgi:hypothetical protein
MFSRDGNVLLDSFILKAIFCHPEKPDPIKTPNSAGAKHSLDQREEIDC